MMRAMNRLGRLVVSALAASLALAGHPAHAAERARASKHWTVGFQGVGPVKAGMTVKEAEKALKVKLEDERLGTPDFEACHYAGNRKELPGLGFMVLRGKIARVDVHGGDYRTAAGAGVGTTEDELKKLYPRAQLQQHPYLAIGHYLWVTSEDGKYSLLFETAGNAVTSLRSGEKGAVASIEGCL